MKNGFVNANVNKSLKKQYSYHGMKRDCTIQPDPDPENYFISKYGPFPIYEKELKITTLYQCGEAHWPPNLFAPLGYVTCNPNFVREDDMNYLYAKTRWAVGNGQALYNKESLLDKLKHKVVAIQSVTVYMKGEVKINVPGNHPNCGPNMGKLFVACSYTENTWQGECYYPGSINIYSYEWDRCKPMYQDARYWDMKYFEEYAKIGFRVDQCLEDDPADYGINRTRGYYIYCKVRYKKSMVVSLGFDSLEWDIGDTWVWLYGKIIGGERGYFISGFQVWKKGNAGEMIEKTSIGPVSGDDRNIWQFVNGLTPKTEYKYRALLRNTGNEGDTLHGIVKGFITKD
jgi:hypothetical protein